jgi:D-aminoacyl-tRNA deacylase
MKHSIIVSKKCPAGMNIAEQLKAKGFKETEREFDGNKVWQLNESLELVFINELHIYAETIQELKTDSVIFATTHKSEKGTASLTVHPIGNFGKAELGGKDKTLVPCSAVLMKTLLKNLKQEAESAGIEDEWEVTREVTHHGPFNDKPTCFIEIGSSEKQWQDERASKVIANTLLKSLPLKEEKWRIAIGAGGGHYCPEFTKTELRTDFALGHVVPKYAMESFDESTFKQMVEKTVEGPAILLLDWKGMTGEQRKKVISFCEASGLEWAKTRAFL